MADERRIYDNIISTANINDKGFYISRCENIMFELPTRPKTLQRKGNQTKGIHRYRELLRKELEKHRRSLDIIKDKEMLLYIIAYLIPKNFIKYDVDNISPHFLDVLKEFTSTDKVGDNLVKILSVEKSEVTSNPKEAQKPEECEEFLVFIAHESYKQFLFR